MHHALMMKTPEQKLSKSDRATGIRELRAAGWTRRAGLGMRMAVRAMCRLHRAKWNC